MAFEISRLVYVASRTLGGNGIIDRNVRVPGYKVLYLSFITRNEQSLLRQDCHVTRMYQLPTLKYDDNSVFIRARNKTRAHDVAFPSEIDRVSLCQSASSSRYSYT